MVPLTKCRYSFLFFKFLIIGPVPVTASGQKGAAQKAQLQDELASLRAQRTSAVASAKVSFGSAVDEAKKVTNVPG